MTQEEKELYNAANTYAFDLDWGDLNTNRDIFVAGAEWQKEQFEKERLKHCDELTAEQAQIESEFVAQHFKKNNRIPTYIDAIEYGKQILANSAKTCKIENYQEEGWYSSGDDEYICGISFDEPIKLPVEFYYKKKEVNND